MPVSPTAEFLAMTQLGDTVFVSYETSRKLRKEGWRPTNDVVVMTYVGKPDPKKTLSNRQRANRWSWSQHEFVNRKIAEQRT